MREIYTWRKLWAPYRNAASIHARIADSDIPGALCETSRPRHLPLVSVYVGSGRYSSSAVKAG